MHNMRKILSLHRLCRNNREVKTLYHYSHRYFTKVVGSDTSPLDKNEDSLLPSPFQDHHVQEDRSGDTAPWKFKRDINIIAGMLSKRKNAHYCSSNSAVQNMLRRIKSMHDIQWNVKDANEFEILLEAFLTCGLKREGYALMQETSLCTERLLSSIIISMAQKNEVWQAQEAVEAGQKLGISMNQEAYAALFMALGRGAKIMSERAIRLYDAAFCPHDRYKTVPSQEILIAMTTVAAALNNWPMFQQFVTQCLTTSQSNSLPPHRVYARILTACGKSRKGLFAYDVFQDMLKHVRDPDNSTYACAIAACGHAGNLPGAEDIYQHMLDRGQVKPNISIYRNLISVYAHTNHVDKARHYFQEMQQKGMRPDVATYTSMCFAYARARRAPEALRLLEELQDRNNDNPDVDMTPNQLTWNNVILACARTPGYLEEALNLVMELPVKKRRLPNDRNFIFRNQKSYEYLMDGFIRAKRWTMAISFWQGSGARDPIRRRASSSKMLNYLLLACRETQDLDTARSIMRSFQNRHPHRRMYFVQHNYVLSTFLQLDRLDEALAYYDDLLDTQRQDDVGYPPRSLHYFQFNEFTFTCLINAAVQRGHMHDRVMDLFEDYLSYRQAKASNLSVYSDLPPSSMIYVLVMEDCLAHQNYDQVFNIFNMVMKDQNSSHLPRVIQHLLYRYVIFACEQCEDWRQAVQYFEHQRQLGLPSDVESYHATVRAVAKAGTIEESLEQGDWYRSNRNDTGWFQ